MEVTLALAIGFCGGIGCAVTIIMYDWIEEYVVSWKETLKERKWTKPS